MVMYEVVEECGPPAQLSTCGLQRDSFFLQVFYILF